MLWFLAVALILGWGWGFFILESSGLIHLLLLLGVVITGIYLFKKDHSVG